MVARATILYMVTLLKQAMMMVPQTYFMAKVAMTHCLAMQETMNFMEVMLLTHSTVMLLTQAMMMEL